MIDSPLQPDGKYTFTVYKELKRGIVLIDICDGKAPSFVGYSSIGSTPSTGKEAQAAINALEPFRLTGTRNLYRPSAYSHCLELFFKGFYWFVHEKDWAGIRKPNRKSTFTEKIKKLWSFWESL